MEKEKRQKTAEKAKEKKEIRAREKEKENILAKMERERALERIQRAKVLAKAQVKVRVCSFMGERGAGTGRTVPTNTDGLRVDVSRADSKVIVVVSVL